MAMARKCRIRVVLLADLFLEIREGYQVREIACLKLSLEPFAGALRQNDVAFKIDIVSDRAPDGALGWKPLQRPGRLNGKGRQEKEDSRSGSYSCGTTITRGTWGDFVWLGEMRPQQEMKMGRAWPEEAEYITTRKESSLVSKMAATGHASVWLADGGVKKVVEIIICYRMAFWAVVGWRS
jgi:hypothetical protein